MSQAQFLQKLGLKNFDYPVPVHANRFSRLIGGLALTAFLMTFVTGIVLSQFYNPSPGTAHTSVRYIMHVPWLEYVRSLHYLSANIGLALVIVHMLRILFSHGYIPPRIGTYLFGIFLLLAVFFAYFTGTVLKWDQEGYEAMAHFVAINKLLGPIGTVFQEDFTLSTSMLARMNALHVSVIPLLFILFGFGHAILIKQHGIAPLPLQSHESYNKSLASGVTFYRHIRKLALYGSLLFVILAVAAYFYVPDLLGTPKAGIEVTKPPWPFWVFYPMESLMGVGGIVFGSALFLIAVLGIPILALVIHDQRKLMRIVTIITSLGLFLWLSQVIATYFMPVMQHM